MIKKENRLLGKRLVGKILAKGSSFRTEHLSCRYLLAKEADPVRLTVVVGKKISNDAVVRNKLKRRVREAFADQLDQYRGASLVIFPTKAALEADFAKLQEEASRCLKGGSGKKLL